ncbi:phage tail assembly chaperone [Thermoleptolyngbya sichuanensis XZ-Cy5]|nr:phage tail assembly chaperone [Thermoleptolyngbya sichuanensis XZ-Cy5]
MSVLKLRPAETFQGPADIPVPGQEPAKVWITWRHKGKTDLMQWIESASSRDDVDLMAEVIVSWGSEVDEPYSREALARLLNAYPGAAQALFFAYRRELTEGRRKNS